MAPLISARFAILVLCTLLVIVIGPANAGPIVIARQATATVTVLPCPGLPSVADGSCGISVGHRCSTGCCSSLGFCGEGEHWCLNGCQLGWGDCWSDRQPAGDYCARVNETKTKTRTKTATATANPNPTRTAPPTQTAAPPPPAPPPPSPPSPPVSISTASSKPKPTPAPIPKSGWDGPQVGAYFAQWGVYARWVGCETKDVLFPVWSDHTACEPHRNYKVKDIDTSHSASKLTFINYAFGNIYKSPDGTGYTCGIVNRMESGNGDGGDAWADFGKGYSASDSVDGVADTWDEPLAGSFGQLRKLKLKYPGLKVLISLGGWTWSRWFSDAASTDSSRKKLVKSCVDLYLRGNLPVIDGRGGPGAAAGVFDGIDIDWEFPGLKGLDYNTVSPQDGDNFVLLLAEFRAQLDALSLELKTGQYYGLTAAISAGNDKIAMTNPGKYSRQLDWLLLMTYDYFGGWDATGPTDFHSHLYPDPKSPHVTNTTSGQPSRFAQYNSDSAVTNILRGGAPASKIIFGVPFYGRGWTGVPMGNNSAFPGLYQKANGPAPGKIEAGIQDYKVLRTLGEKVIIHPVTKQSYVYVKGEGTFWSYDTAEVIGTKVKYAKEKGLKGVFACG